MKRIPLLQTNILKNKKTIADIATRLTTDSEVIPTAYLFDSTGIKKNQPALELHQYIRRWFETIVDAGCQHVGDVVDVLLAGAEIIVLRPEIWREPDFLTVRDISESEIYVWYDVLYQKNNPSKNHLLNEADGIILYVDHIKTPMPFIVRDSIRSMISARSAEHILVFDPKRIHEKELEVFGLNTMIVDVSELVGTYE